MQKVRGLAPNERAILMAMGAMMAPQAVFEMNSVRNVPNVQTKMKASRAFEPQRSVVWSASSCASPVASMAFPSVMEQANTISTSQLMAFLACLMSQQRVISISRAAMKQLVSSGSTLSAESRTMPIMMRAAYRVRKLLCAGCSSSSLLQVMP